MEFENNTSNDENNVIARSQLLNGLLLSDKIDLCYLRQLSRQPGGFQSTELRARIWPKLFNINRYSIQDFRIQINESHRDRSQVNVDVERSLWNMDVNEHWDDVLRSKRRKVLSDIINSVLSKHDHLYYYQVNIYIYVYIYSFSTYLLIYMYQGYHDVVSIFLHVFEDDNLAYEFSEQVSLTYFLDFMNESFSLFSKILRLLMIILKREDNELFTFLDSINLEPFCCTSWLIAWFSHDIKSLHTICRLFDVLICSHPIYILYICAAV